MSRVAQDWVSSSRLVGNKRFVLRELAECHNQGTGRCDPAIKKDRSEPTGRSLNELTGIGEAKLSTLLDELEADGWLIRERRHWKKNGWRASDQFHLAIPGFEKAWVDDRMTSAKARTVTLGAKEPKALVQAVPKREFGASLSVTRAGAYQEGRTGKEETTSTVNGSSYVADKFLSTSTTGVGGAVEVKKQLLGNHPSQGTNHEQDPQPLVAKLERPKSQDEAESNGSGKGVGARTVPKLPAEVQAACAKYPACNVGELLVQWRRHGDAAGLLRYCEARAGVGRRRVLKPHEAEAEAFPDHPPGARRFSRLEPVAA